MKLYVFTLVCSIFLALSGCGTESVLFQSQQGILFTAQDRLAPPGQPVRIQARVQTGDFLTGQKGLPVRFYRDGKLFKTTLTNAEGCAEVTFTPPRPGDYTFTAELVGIGFSGPIPPTCEILLACRAGDSPMVIVDMDKTIVASGFQTVLLSDPLPAEGSQKVLHQLAQSYTVVYLTHRPEYFGPKSKAWLQHNHFPQGPVILSSLSGFLKGSQAFKSAALADLRSRFSRIEIGIGDKISDALAYHENRMKAYLILLDLNSQNDLILSDLLRQLRTVPDSIQVATQWSQIDTAINQNTPCPPSRTISYIESLLPSRKSQQGVQP
jgi:hypothetical protein